MMVFLVMFGIAMSGLIVVFLTHGAFAQFGQTLNDRRLSEVVNQTASSQSSQIDVGGGAIEAMDVSELRNTVYVVKPDSDTVSAISGEDNTRIKDIEVGNYPVDIAVNDGTETAYVANWESDSVSVIDLGNNTKRGADISVGGLSPSGIAVDEEYTEEAYVANHGSDSVSVIDGMTYEPEINPTTNQPLTIPVREQPEGIAVHENYGLVYVASWETDSVSVINATTDEPEINPTTNQPLTIPVGNEPLDIAVNEITNTVYVANQGSEGVSVIDGETNELVTGVTFHVEPFNSGYIVCDDPAITDTNDLTTPLAPVGQYVYVSSGTQCMAKPYEGFEFLSWEQNLEDNSTQLLSFSAPASPLDSFLEYIRQNKSSDKPEAKLMTEFGTFTANFMKAPAPLPPEFWAQMYAVIATVITALFIPSIIGWTKSRRDVRKLNYYHKQIASLYADGKLDEKDIDPLNRLRSSILDAYSQGKINEKHYQSLRNETSTLYEEIFRKKIDSLNHKSSNNEIVKEQLTQIRNEVEYAYSKGRIIQKHYDLLTKAVSNLDTKEDASE